LGTQPSTFEHSSTAVTSTAKGLTDGTSSYVTARAATRRQQRKTLKEKAEKTSAAIYFDYTGT
jgi:hypothetical protein